MRALLPLAFSIASALVTACGDPGGGSSKGDLGGTGDGGGDGGGAGEGEDGGEDSGPGIPEKCEKAEDCAALEVEACEIAACDLGTGTCLLVAAATGTPCGEDACVEGRVCEDGACKGGQPVDCDDEDPCTTEVCDPSLGCLYDALPDCCTPKCAGKDCGGDGCGGSCGTCTVGWTCLPDGTCTDCVPACDGECGDDGCGGSCGSCGDGLVCEAGACVPCVAACDGKSCGDDGCGGSCGACPPGKTCSATFQCGDCFPACFGKSCGDDGCGGSCGTCLPGLACSSAGACEDPTLGDTCANPFVIAGIPYSKSSDTSDASNAYAHGTGVCPGAAAAAGQKAPDDVYVLTPGESRNYRVSVDAAFDATVYAVTSCGNIATSCLAAADDFGGEESLVLYVLAGTTVFLVVDGAGSGASAGPYTLTVEPWEPGACQPDCDGKVCGPDGCGGQCGACTSGQSCAPGGACVPKGTGEDCNPGFPIETVPASFQGSTALAKDDLDALAGACSGLAGAAGGASPDHAYTFVAPASGTYTFTLSSDFDAVLYVAGDCGSIGSTCSGGSDDVGTLGAEEVTVSLFEGQTRYVVVDGAGSFASHSGSYELSVAFLPKPDCVPACDGKVCGPDGCDAFCGFCADGETCFDGLCLAEDPGPVCDVAIPIDELPFVDQASTEGAPSSFGYGPGQCPDSSQGYGQLSPEHVYRLDAEVSTPLQIIALSSAFDLTIYVVKSCADPGGTCVAAAEQNFGPGTEVLPLDVEAGETYFIVIDGTTGGFGTYTISIQED